MGTGLILEKNIVIDGHRHWVRRIAPGRFEVLRKRATHSVVCAVVSFPERPDYAKDLALAEFKRRENSKTEWGRY